MRATSTRPDAAVLIPAAILDPAARRRRAQVCLRLAEPPCPSSVPPLPITLEPPPHANPLRRGRRRPPRHPPNIVFECLTRPRPTNECAPSGIRELSRYSARRIHARSLQRYVLRRSLIRSRSRTPDGSRSMARPDRAGPRSFAPTALAPRPTNECAPSGIRELSRSSARRIHARSLQRYVLRRSLIRPRSRTPDGSRSDGSRSDGQIAPALVHSPRRPWRRDRRTNVRRREFVSSRALQPAASTQDRSSATCSDARSYALARELRTGLARTGLARTGLARTGLAHTLAHTLSLTNSGRASLELRTGLAEMPLRCPTCRPRPRRDVHHCILSRAKTVTPAYLSIRRTRLHEGVVRSGSRCSFRLTSPRASDVVTGSCLLVVCGRSDSRWSSVQRRSRRLLPLHLRRGRRPSRRRTTFTGVPTR